MKAIAIVGPTASGKTALSLKLASHFGGEILSMDSMQVYRGLDIGTAKATPEEQALCPHHLINIRDPREAFSAADYAKEAMDAANEVSLRGSLPIFVGGTGLYLDAVRTLRHRDSAPGPDPELRLELAKTAETPEGKLALYEELKTVDPEAAKATHPNNTRRVIRALEIYKTTGITKTETDKMASTQNPDIDILVIGLRFQNRETLYKRIEQRVDRMIADGLLEETAALLEKGLLPPGSTARGAIGYKELLGYLGGETSLEDAVASLKTASRRYAKRQMTWFSKDPHIHWLTVDAEGGIQTADALFEQVCPLVKSFISSTSKETLLR